MIIWKVLRLQHENAVNIQFMFLGYYIDHNVSNVVTLPDATVYILETEETAEILYAVLGAAHEDYLEVS